MSESRGVGRAQGERHLQSQRTNNVNNLSLGQFFAMQTEDRGGSFQFA